MVNSKIKLFSVLAVLALMFCSLVPMVDSEASDAAQATTENEKETYKYVSLGDSMSAGYGMPGYSGGSMGFLADVEGRYTEYVAKLLEYELGEKYDVEHLALTIGGLRSTDLRAILDETFVGNDEYPGDDYTKEILVNEKLHYADVYAKAKQEYPEFQLEKLDLLRAIYQKELMEADVITYQQHLDYIYGLALPIAGPILIGTETNYDFTLFYDAEFADTAAQIAASVEKVVIDYLKEKGIDIAAYKEYIDVIVKGVIYSVTSYCCNFDAIMGFIFENNPDAKVIVADTYSIFDGMCVKIGDTVVDVGELYTTLIGIGNYYTEYGSPYSMYCYHVSIDDHPYLFCDEFKYLDVDNLPAKELKDYLTDESKANLICALTSLSEESSLEPADPMGVIVYNNYDEYGNLSKFANAIFRSTEVDIMSALALDYKEVMTRMGNAVGAISKDKDKCTVVFSEEDGSATVKGATATYTFTKDELVIIGTLLNISRSALMTHTGPIGHEYVAACIIEKIIADDIVAMGDRVYIGGYGYEVVAPGETLTTPMGFVDLCLFLDKASVRGLLNYTYKNWDMATVIVYSEAYLTFYQELVNSYIEWSEFYKSGNLELAVEEVRVYLVSLDENWDSIFGEYAELPAMVKLHTVLKGVLLEWDAVKTSVQQYAEVYNQLFLECVEFFEPESIRALLNETIFVVSARETILNISLHFETFYYDLIKAIEAAETPEQVIIAIKMIVMGYVSPCHDTKEFIAVEPTCTEGGCIEHYKCKLCDSYFVQDESGKFTQVAEDVAILPPNGHSYVDHPAVAPTCVKGGNNQYYTCENCDAVFKADKTTPTTVEDETLAALGHKHVKIPGVTPTKTHTGLTEGEKCSVCGEILVEQTILPATGTDDVVITTTTSNVLFYVANSDEIKELVVIFKNVDLNNDVTITIPESEVKDLKGKYIDFTAEKSYTYSNAFTIVMKTGTSVTDGELIGAKQYNGNAFIGVPFDTKKGDPSIKWVEGDVLMEITDKSNGVVTFETTHNSTYQITYTPVRDMVPVIVSIVFVIIVALAAGLFWRKSRE